VNKAAADVKTEAEEPEHDQYQSDCPKHARNLPLSGVPARTRSAVRNHDSFFPPITRPATTPSRLRSSDPGKGNSPPVRACAFICEGANA
jgi:hypothetical protein